MKFLFLCTGNSCRSILSEVLFNSRAPEGWQVHPLTLETLENLGLSTEGLWSKTINDCEQYQPDVVITVCDSAAQEACPLYLGGAIKAHWGLADPSHLDVNKEEKMKAFMSTVEHINRRLDALFKLNVDKLSRSELIAAINQISNVE